MKERMVRREPGASPSSLLGVSIRTKFRDMLRRRGGAGIRNMLRGRGDEAANLSSTLMQRSGCPLAAIRRGWRDRRRLGAGGPTNPSRLGPPTSGRLSGGVGHRPGLNSNRQGWGGVVTPQSQERGGRRQEVPSSLRGHRGHGAAPGPLPAGEGARPPGRGEASRPGAAAATRGGMTAAGGGGGEGTAKTTGGGAGAPAGNTILLQSASEAPEALMAALQNWPTCPVWPQRKQRRRC